MANFVTGNVTPYFFGKNVSRVTFRVTGVFSENCHGLVKRCHVEKKNAGRRSIAGTAQATLPHHPRPTLSPRTSALSLGGVGGSRANVRGESVGRGWWGRVA